MPPENDCNNGLLGSVIDFMSTETNEKKSPEGMTTLRWCQITSVTELLTRFVQEIVLNGIALVFCGWCVGIICWLLRRKI